MEVGWPQLLWILILWQKSAFHAKFGHYSTSGSLVMSLVVQKTSNTHPPLRQIGYPWKVSESALHDDSEKHPVWAQNI